MDIWTEWCDIGGQEGKRWMEWKNWNPREGKIANEDLITGKLEQEITMSSISAWQLVWIGHIYSACIWKETTSKLSESG